MEGPSYSVASRRFMLSVLAAVPTLPTLFGVTTARAQTAPLASLNGGPAKQAILDFVKATTDQASKDFVAPGDRIATFDQDGTLWVEHPLYSQAMFALDRVHALAPKHPEWKAKEPFKSVLANDMAAMGHFSERDWAEIVFVTHAGMSQAAFLEIVAQWLATAKHPRFKRPYTDLVYQPMIEVLSYLRANQFETFIVTGGGQTSCVLTASGSMAYPLRKSSAPALLQNMNSRPIKRNWSGCQSCSSTTTMMERRSASICSW